MDEEVVLETIRDKMATELTGDASDKDGRTTGLEDEVFGIYRLGVK